MRTEKVNLNSRVTSSMLPIDKALLGYFVCGEGPAIRELRNGISSRGFHTQKRRLYEDFIDNLIEFFNARTDTNRIIYAQKISDIVLSVHDLQDLNEVRKKVAEIELRRIIGYWKQRDHTAHTLNLFLLGIWLYDCVDNIRVCINKYLQSQIPSDTAQQPDQKVHNHNHEKDFIFQWLHVSLLHDLGYVYADLRNDSKEYRIFIDNLFGFDWIEYLLKKELDANEQNICLEPMKLAHDEFLEKYNGDNILFSVNTLNNASKVLERLRSIPWIKDKVLGLPEANDVIDIFEIFKKHSKKERDLECHARVEATNNGVVDHAVASGLILARYVTYWYWLLATVKEQKNEQAYEILTKHFSYKPENLPVILKVCAYVAYHNIKILDKTKKFEIDEPLVFLEILCDELAFWERFPASQDLKMLWEDEVIESDILLVMSLPDGPLEVAKFALMHIKAAEIGNKLDERLACWDREIKIVDNTGHQLTSRNHPAIDELEKLQLRDSEKGMKSR